VGGNMDKPTITVTDIKDRIIESMRAKKMEIQAELNSSACISNKGVNEIGNKINQLDTEARYNNLKWNIVTDWAVTSDGSFKGKILQFIKKATRKLLRWYINPPLYQQKEFNGSVTRSINILKDLVYNLSDEAQKTKVKTCELFGEVENNDSKILEMRDALKSNVEDTDRKISELCNIVEGKQDNILDSVGRFNDELSCQIKAELSFIADRLRRIERKINTSLGLDIKTPTIENMVIKDKRQNPDLNYFLFEQRFRGSREDIKERQKIYLDHFIDKSNVLDIGCGRGEFVELLIEKGIGVTGIDINEDMVDYCQDRSLPVIQTDLFDHLNSLSDNSLDGIFAAQVIEHLEPDWLVKFVQLSYEKLKANGVFLVETVNLQTLLTFSNQFYMDLSHKKPVHPLTLQFIMESEGFNKTKFIYTSPCTSSMIPDLYIEGSNNNLQEFNQAINRLNKLLYGPQDYAIVCVK
jgi:2-polyprenyl-3-methyl-5-hydroxy-6-metoxy-1,4-benzoquinol methylase